VNEYQILKSAGLQEERLDMFFMSGGQGQEFAERAKMTERVKKLGPNPLKK